ncbi:protein translocase subunit SecF [Candidatus Woesearchaeota archaeon]|nr:protein translocase subunit SecF [Candidatus Woesearchaeota archaeon]
MSRRERKLLRRKGKRYTPDRTLEEHKESGAVQATPAKKKTRKFFSTFLDFYEHKYKKAMWFTIAMLIISIIVIGVHTAMTGEFIPRGVSLKGGVTITVPYEDDFDTDALQSYLRGEFPKASISVRAMTQAGEKIGFIVDASDADPEELLASIQQHVGKIENFGLETMGSALGEAFFKQTLLAMLIAFVLMSLVVFLSFKTFVPSFAVILSAVSDITMTIAVIDIFGIRIETAGIAALLMLIGYSVDTDVLLTTRVLKREEGTVIDRVYGAMKTGMTMTFTSIAAIAVALIFTQSETLRQIMLILLIGLIFDIPNTWIQNAGILRMYMERRSKKHAAATLADYRQEEEFEERVYEDDEDEEEKEPEEPKPAEHAHHEGHPEKKTHETAHHEHHAHTEHHKEHEHKEHKK